MLAVLVGCLAVLAIGPVAAAEAASGSISGTVTEFAGGHAGIKGVTVTVYTLDGDFVTSASTLSNGEYDVTGLSAGEYNVQFADTPTFTTQYYNDETSLENADPVTVIEGKATTGIEAALKETGKISGRVTNSSGAPLANVDVEIYGTGEFEFEEFFTSVSTNGNGEYTVTGLPEGNYKVGFFSQEAIYLAQYYNGESSFGSANSVKVTAAKTTTGINAALKEGGKISGTVTDASTHAGLAKIGVEVYGPNGGGYASTNANGEYTVTGLATGSYTVVFYWEYSEAEFKEFEHAARFIPKYITQFYNDQPSSATANPVGATEGTLTSGINAAMVASAPVNTAPPVVSGTPTLASALSCSNGSWTGEPELKLAAGWPFSSPFTYQWLRDGAAIAGATTAGYVVQSADLGHGLVCEVTATNGAGHASAKSASLAVARPVPVLTVAASKLTVAKGATKVKLACATATCAGSIELVEKPHKGKKTVLAKGSYSLAAGKTGTVTLRLSSAGKKKLAKASHHRTSPKLVASVTGGKTVEKTVQLGLAAKK